MPRVVPRLCAGELWSNVRRDSSDLLASQKGEGGSYRVCVVDDSGEATLCVCVSRDPESADRDWQWATSVVSGLSSSRRTFERVCAAFVHSWNRSSSSSSSTQSSLHELMARVQQCSPQHQVAGLTRRLQAIKVAAESLSGELALTVDSVACMSRLLDHFDGRGGYPKETAVSATTATLRSPRRCSMSRSLCAESAESVLPRTLPGQLGTHESVPCGSPGGDERRRRRRNTRARASLSGQLSRTRVPDWSSDGVFLHSVVTVPQTQKVRHAVASLLIFRDQIWAGLTGGQVFVTSMALASKSGYSSGSMISLHSTSVAEMVEISGEIFCSSHEGALFVVDPYRRVLSRKVPVNDAAHKLITSIVHDPAHGRLWSAGLSEERKETQLFAAGLSAGASRTSSTCIPQLVLMLRCYRGSLLALCADSLLVIMDRSSGVPVRVVVCKPSAPVAVVPVLDDSLWSVTATGQLIVHSGDVSQDGEQNDRTLGVARLLSGDIRALVPAQTPNGGCIATVGTLGCVALWNVADLSCECCVEGGPDSPRCIAAGVLPRLVFWVVAEDLALHVFQTATD